MRGGFKIASPLSAVFVPINLATLATRAEEMHHQHRHPPGRRRTANLPSRSLCEAAHHYLLANGAEITQNDRIMKPYSLIVVMIITAAVCASSFAQDKTSLQANASVAGILQGSAGKSVELHLRSGEKMVGRVAQVTDSIVHLSNLTGGEHRRWTSTPSQTDFDAFVDMKDVSAVVVRVAGR